MLVNMDLIAPDVDTSFYNYMLRVHRALESQYAGLLAALEINSPEARQLWTAIEERLLAHMEAEERYVLPAFARIDREGAIALLRDHGRIREALLELGVGIDLHVARLEPWHAFIDLLREHTSREGELLYTWAETYLEKSLATAAIAHETAHVR